MFDSDSNSNTNKSIRSLLSFINSEKDRIRNMKIMFEIFPLIFDIKFRLIDDNITFRLFFQMLEKNGVDSISFFDSSHNLLLWQSKFRWILVPSFLFKGFFYISSIIFIYLFTLLQLVVFMTVFSDHISDLTIDDTITKKELPLW